MPSKCNRGIVLEVNLDPSIGSACLVVQSDLLNKYSRVTVVSPISGAENIKTRGPTYVPISKGEGGLPKDSIVVCHHASSQKAGQVPFR